MGQQRQQPLMGGRYQQINNAAQMKKYCIWGLSLVVPFLVLFCIFPSGTSVYRLPYNRIVVGQLQVPSSHAGSDHENLASEEIVHQNDGKKQKPRKASVDNPDLTLPKAKHQNDGRKPDAPGIDALSLLSKKSDKQISTVYHVPTLMDRELEQIHEPIADTQIKKSTKKGKIVHHTDEIPDIAVDHELSSSGKEHAEEATLGLITAKSSGGRKPDMLEEEDISSLGKEINADEEDPTSSKAARSKQSTRKAMGLKSEDSIADELQEEEEEVSSLGKGRSSKQRTSQTTKEVGDAEDEVSSLGKGRSSKKKKPKEVEYDGEEEVSSLGKGRSSKQRSRKETKEVDEVEIEEGFTELGKRGDEDVARSYSWSSAIRDELDHAAEAVSSLGKGRSSKQRLRKENKEVDEGEIEERFTESGKMKDELDHAADEVSSSGKGRSSKQRLRKENKEVDEGEIEDLFTESGKMMDHAAEEVSSLGKGRSSKQRSRKGNNEVDEVEIEERLTESGKMGDEDVVESHRSFAIKDEEGAADLLFLEREDQKMFIKGSTKKKNVERINEDLDDQDDDPKDFTSHVIGKALPFNTKQSKTPGECKYFKGKWIAEAKHPLYMDSTCHFASLNEEQECKVIKTRGKSTNWRWQSSDCNMERFKAKAFLKLIQRKSLAFIGDKLAKAQMESLLCLLAQAERPNLVYNDKTNQSMSWHFNSSNVTLSMIWSPYLVQEVSEEGFKKLRLDKLDTKWAVMVPTIDVLVLGIGPLFIYPTIYTVRDEVVGCYACQSLASHINITNLKEISLYSGFRATMRSSIMGVGALPGFKGITFFLQPFGFEGNGSYLGVSMKMKEIQEEELHQGRKRGSISNHSKMKVLHTHLVSMSKYDPMQGLLTPTCLIPRLLVDTWNQFLQHTLTHLADFK